MKGGLSMYLLKYSWLERINIAAQFGHKPSMDCMHWLNPLLHKCEKRLYPECVGEQPG